MYCIYMITNKSNGHSYIGQHRYLNESNPMGRYKGSGKKLWLAYNKYGFDMFKTEILYSRIRDKPTVDAMEIWAISKYKPYYNIAAGGTGGATMTGRHHSEETKRLMSVKAKGRVISTEQRQKISNTLKGNIPWNKGKSGYHTKPNSPDKLGRKWFNNGTINIMAKECPEGFIRGMLKHVK